MVQNDIFIPDLSGYSFKEIGEFGEQFSGRRKNTKHIESITQAASYRVPDMLTKKALIEVKTYRGLLSYTSQIKDYHLYSLKYNLQMYIITDASLSGTLQKVVDTGEIIIVPLGIYSPK